MSPRMPAAPAPTRPYLAREAQRQAETLQRRHSQYTPGRPPVDPAGRIVIVVDDGLATGATMIAALHSVRSRNPARLVCAVPVAAPDSVELVRPYADDVVCIATPPDFHAVGQFYAAIPQVADEEVKTILCP